MKDAVATMGDLLPDDASGRDAVHVAVFSAISKRPLSPGQRVGIVALGTTDAEVSSVGDLCGIVDPFLEMPVIPGDRFWVYLYPRTITALSHRWSHPAFESAAIERAALAVPVGDPTQIYVTPAMKLASERWLRAECDNGSMPGYEALLEAVETQMSEGEECLCILGSDAYGDIPTAMWTHLENVLGRRLPASKPSYFSCSC